MRAARRLWHAASVGERQSLLAAAALPQGIPLLSLLTSQASTQPGIAEMALLLELAIRPQVGTGFRGRSYLHSLYKLRNVARRGRNAKQAA
jgi:hypothetical protein